MMKVNFIPNNNFKEISFYDVLEAAATNDVNTLSIFDDAVVVVGPSARSIGDLGPNPLYEKSPNFLYTQTLTIKLFQISLLLIHQI